MPFVSPNDLLEAARAEMLEGREPASKNDWALLMNYVAFNVDSSLVVPICCLFLKMYDIPLSKKEVTEIANFQGSQKNG